MPEKSFEITLTYEGDEPTEKDILIVLISGHATLREPNDDDPTRHKINYKSTTYKASEIFGGK